MSGLVLRDATLADAPTVAALHAESWRSAYAGVLPAAYLEGQVEAERGAVWEGRLGDPRARQFAVLAERDRQPVGFVCLIFDEEPGYGATLDNLHVRPQFKRQGVGQVLMREAARRVLATEPTWPMHLWVFSDNLAAQSFYAALGGRAVETKDKPTPAGTSVASVRYVWHDLSRLARGAE